MLVKFEQNCMVQTIRNFELFDRKPVCFFLPFLTKRWRHGRRLYCWNYCLMLNYLSKDYHLSVFQKLRHSNTWNQVKSCLKHGRPHQSQRELTVASSKLSEKFCLMQSIVTNIQSLQISATKYVFLFVSMVESAKDAHACDKQIRCFFLFRVILNWYVQSKTLGLLYVAEYLK